MDIAIGAVIALGSAALGFLAGRIVVDRAPEIPRKVEGYYPTEDDIEEWSGDGQEG